jgi:diadenylate cyclase
MSSGENEACAGLVCYSGDGGAQAVMTASNKQRGGSPRSKRSQAGSGAKDESRPKQRRSKSADKARGGNGSGRGASRSRAPHPAALDDGLLSNMVIDHALEMADKLGARAVFISADLLPQMRALDASKRPFDIYIVASDVEHLVPPDARACKLLKVPNIPVGRVGKIKVAMVMAASRNLLRLGDRVVCVSGLPAGGMLDTIMVMQVGTETEVMSTTGIGDFAKEMKAGVFDTVLELALELANEGREGKPVGTIFVIGDIRELRGHVRQMVLNPFKGYTERERQILDPSVRATIKEFSTIDGAFIINSKGVVQSAGTYLEPRAVPTDLPPGLGARHHAAASITAAVPGSISIAVSESTGEVRVFRNGVAVADIEPGLSRGASGETEATPS